MDIAEAIQILIDAAEMAVSDWECDHNQDWADSVRDAIAQEDIQILIDAAKMAVSEYECDRNQNWANSVREAITLLHAD